MHWATGICPLVKLAGQVFHCQHPFIRPRRWGGFLVNIVHLRLGQDGLLGHMVIRFVNILNVVAVEHPNAGNILCAQGGAKIAQNPCSLYGKRASSFLQNNDKLPYSLSYFLPMSVR